MNKLVRFNVYDWVKYRKQNNCDAIMNLVKTWINYKLYEQVKILAIHVTTYINLNVILIIS